MCKKNILHLVSPEILNELAMLREMLIRDPDFNLVRQSKICSFLKHNANRHSVELEFSNKKNHKKKALKNLTIAKEYLCKDFEGELEEGQIKNTAALINGYDNQVPYRTSCARTVDKEGYFIYPENVASEMHKFVYVNKCFDNPLEKAIHSHFNIARIHPFDDGNGRLARLVQNTFLEFNKYPPIIISFPERDKYLDLLSNAAREYRVEGCLKPSQVKFYDYLCSKLRESLEGVRKQIRKNNLK